MLTESRIQDPESRLLGWANAVLRFVLAPTCASCQSMLSAPLDGPVCRGCWTAVRPITPPICDSCGDPLPAWRLEGCCTARCPQCRRTPRSIDRSRAIGEYDGALRQIIHALKYDGRRSIAQPLGKLMQKHGSTLLKGADWAVPVPLHPRREGMRGFNQAAELARHLDLPVCFALQRVRHSVPQVDLPASRRHANVRGAFRLAGWHGWRAASRGHLPDLSHACVLLVDDVSTTGATLDACARVLKEAGVAEVRAITAARVVRPQSPSPLR
jgi:ComF family protein